MRHVFLIAFVLVLFGAQTTWAKKEVAVEFTVSEELQDEIKKETSGVNFGSIKFNKKCKDLITGSKTKDFEISCKIEFKKGSKNSFTITLYDQRRTTIFGDIKIHKTTKYTDNAMIPIEITKQIIDLVKNNEVPSITINDPSIQPDNKDRDPGDKRHPAILTVNFGNRPR